MNSVGPPLGVDPVGKMRLRIQKKKKKKKFIYHLKYHILCTNIEYRYKYRSIHTQTNNITDPRILDMISRPGDRDGIFGPVSL